MKLKITQEYFYTVEADWYDPDVLSGGGTLQEQITEYEKENVESYVMGLEELERGKTTVEVVDDESDTSVPEQKD